MIVVYQVRPEGHLQDHAGGPADHLGHGASRGREERGDAPLPAPLQHLQYQRLQRRHHGAHLLQRGRLLPEEPRLRPRVLGRRKPDSGRHAGGTSFQYTQELVCIDFLFTTLRDDVFTHTFTSDAIVVYRNIVM